MLSCRFPIRMQMKRSIKVTTAYKYVNENQQKQLNRLFQIKILICHYNVLQEK